MNLHTNIGSAWCCDKCHFSRNNINYGGCTWCSHEKQSL